MTGATWHYESDTPSPARTHARRRSFGGVMAADEPEREIGDLAVWSLSTAKPGNGVDQLRDDNTDTYWQSDGPQPHLINVQVRMRPHAIRRVLLTAPFAWLLRCSSTRRCGSTKL